MDMISVLCGNLAGGISRVMQINYCLKLCIFQTASNSTRLQQEKCNVGRLSAFWSMIIYFWVCGETDRARRK